MAFMLLSGASCYPSGTPPPSTKSIPVYPGANTVISDTTEIGQSQPAKTINFQTRDKREAVIRYYKDVLLKDGWKLNTVYTPEPSGSRFSWTTGCPISVIEVTTPITTGEQIEVEVVLKTYGCE